jgi:hypothetical protein
VEIFQHRRTTGQFGGEISTCGAPSRSVPVALPVLNAFYCTMRALPRPELLVHALDRNIPANLYLLIALPVALSRTRFSAPISVPRGRQKGGSSRPCTPHARSTGCGLVVLRHGEPPDRQTAV